MDGKGVLCSSIKRFSQDCYSPFLCLIRDMPRCEQDVCSNTNNFAEVKAYHHRNKKPLNTIKMLHRLECFHAPQLWENEFLYHNNKEPLNLQQSFLFILVFVFPSGMRISQTTMGQADGLNDNDCKWCCYKPQDCHICVEINGC
ncbi:CLUMA_CG014547, isoform A [Clunio marinus]|uniref:CLUMA_CG014547, isoform A n=1 Tax=Clunio marinus TaxID=568069 RepID=A0A1J1IR63_9DIPT|nr:CLUMA_CG014547, isoform A [Clunio marinus]